MLRPRLTTRAHALAFTAAALFADAMADGRIDDDEFALLTAAHRDTVALTFALSRGIETPKHFDRLVNAARASLDEVPSYTAAD